jgi:hypothetical protein
MAFMFSFFSGGKFISIGEKIRLPDDVTMGYIIGKYSSESYSYIVVMDRACSKHLGADGIILKCMVWFRQDSSTARFESLAGCCVNGNEQSGSIKWREIPE